jgi:SAM-dependent methyltransferase
VPRNLAEGDSGSARPDPRSPFADSHRPGEVARDRAGAESERAELLLRLSELDRQLKWSRAHGAERWDEELHACRLGIAELHRQLDAIHTSESWRFGNRFTRAVLTVGRPVAIASTKLRRAWRSRAENRYRTYRQATSAGSPIATLDDPAAASEIDESHRGPLGSFVRVLRRARSDGPQLLEPNELHELRRVLASTNAEHELIDRARKLLTLLEPIDSDRSTGRGSGSLVIDVRALQIPIECGTKTHAEHVARAVCSAVPRRTRVLMLRSPALPDVPPQIAALFDGRFVPGATPLNEVSAFLQLMTFTRGDDRDDFDLLRAPWIRRAAVWLDAIMGRYPWSFLRTDATFLDYQLGIEKLGCADHVLALSASCRDELPPNLGPTTRVTISASRPGLTPADARSARISTPDEGYCVVMGNALPHKNIAGGVAAFAGSCRARRERLTLIVVAAALDEAQRQAILRLMEAAGADPTSVAFLSELDRCDLAALIQGAEAVLVPSFHEGFSLPVVESIGLGTPVVASDIAAHRELLGPDPALADAADPVAMAGVLDEVLARRGEVLTRQRHALDDRYDPSRLDQVVTDIVGKLIPPAPRHHPQMMARAASTRSRQPTAHSDSGSRSSLSHSKICNLEDFSHPELVDGLRRHFAHEVARFGPDFPKGREWRKYWEVAMAMRTFADSDLLDGRHDFLGVGAGNEPTVFLLTQYVRRVAATDLYLEPGWEETANASMLTDPASHWPFSWHPTRLQVAHMDACDLRFPDESFHGIFSSSSIEHFGDRQSIARALDEMYRVLAPGGTLSISSEYRIAGPGAGIPGVAMFDTRDIEELFVADRAWGLMDPFDDEVSAATLATALDFETAVEDQARQIGELGGYWTHLIEFSSYPHIVLSRPPYTFTSFHLALRKHA